MKQEADKFVVFKLAADLVEDESQRCEVIRAVFTSKQISCFLTVLLDNWITQVTYGGDGLQIWNVAANILNKE
jgi:hypothetical protein